jgi:hypothetical protein
MGGSLEKIWVGGSGVGGMWEKEDQGERGCRGRPGDIPSANYIR